MQAQLTLYDVAKQMVLNEEVMDTIAANIKIQEFSSTVKNNTYYMLFNPDLRQYVVFHVTNKDNLAKELQEVLLNRGQLLLIDNSEKGVCEFWVKDKFDNEPYMYQFYQYEVVEV